MFSQSKRNASRSVGKTTVFLSLWLLFPANISFWLHLWSNPLDFAVLSQLSVYWALALGSTFFMLGSLAAWPWVYKSLWSLLFLISAIAQYFMLQYGTLIDSTMLGNALHTDLIETRDLLSWEMSAMVLGVAGLPCFWLWRQNLHWNHWLLRLGRNLLAAGLSLVLALSAVWLGFQDVSSLMRNDTTLRYTINPFNTIFGLGIVFKQEAFPKQSGPLTKLDPEAKLGASYHSPAALPPLFVLVLGETARAANFSIGGYGKQTGRNTTPHLQQLKDQEGLVYFDEVSSCGTNTKISVPCIFSPLTRSQGSDQKNNSENILDLLQQSGLAVLWVDNQSGCKGQCQRIPSYSTRDNPPATEPSCKDGECLDEAMLDVLQAQWQALPAERRARGTVIVLHQMGSHGPAYFKRSPLSGKAFTPECTSTTFSDCSREQIVNAYDNSILYTDHFLHQVWLWLKKQQATTALLYVSDHGESLGENNVYLHGFPYVLAPSEQTHVPMAVWLSQAMQKRLGLDPHCLAAKAKTELSHDHVFHSVLGLMDLISKVKQPELDIFASCISSP